MDKISFVLSVMVAAVLLMISACTSPYISEAGKTEIKPCQVSVPMIEQIFAGKESVSIAPYFKISNPNDFPVTLSELRYRVYLMDKDYLCDGKGLDLNYIIPAKGDVTVSSAFAVQWVNLAMWLWDQQGKTMPVAVKDMLPLWKGLNGKLFNPKMKKLWDPIPIKHPVFDIDGEIDILRPGGEIVTYNYETTWTMPEEYKLFK